MNKEKPKHGPKRDEDTGRFLSLYKPEYDAKLISHLAEGLSFRSFAAAVDVNSDTIYQWLKAFPSFAEAKEVGTNKSLLLWERMGMAGTVGKIKNFNTATWIFNMKNRFGWRDRQEIKNLNPEDDFGDVTHKKIMDYIEGKSF